MQPAIPDEPPTGWSADEPAVGAYRQGSAASRWALARYLVGRAIGESIGATLMVLGLVVLALSALVEWGLGWTVLAVLLLLVAVGVLIMRMVLLAILRRLTAVDRFGPLEDRMRKVVRDARADVRRELRRIGLPSHVVTLPLLAVRLAGRRRQDTLTRLRAFDVDHAVPPGRVDELHLVFRDAFGASGGGLADDGRAGPGTVNG